ALDLGPVILIAGEVARRVTLRVATGPERPRQGIPAKQGRGCTGSRGQAAEESAPRSDGSRDLALRLARHEQTPRGGIPSGDGQVDSIPPGRSGGNGAVLPTPPRRDGPRQAIPWYNARGAPAKPAGIRRRKDRVRPWNSRDRRRRSRNSSPDGISSDELNGDLQDDPMGHRALRREALVRLEAWSHADRSARAPAGRTDPRPRLRHGSSDRPDRGGRRRRGRD